MGRDKVLKVVRGKGLKVVRGKGLGVVHGKWEDCKDRRRSRSNYQML